MLNITVEFKDESHLIIQELEKDDTYDYTLAYFNENIFNNINNDHYSNLDYDILYYENGLMIYYIDKNDDFNDLKEAIDVFNLIDKSSHILYDLDNQKMVSNDDVKLGFEKIPTLSLKDVECIIFNQDCNCQLQF